MSITSEVQLIVEGRSPTRHCVFWESIVWVKYLTGVDSIATTSDLDLGYAVTDGQVSLDDRGFFTTDYDTITGQVTAMIVTPCGSKPLSVALNLVRVN